MFNKCMLPTKKAHVSYSEMKDWMDCAYRHKLKHINKIDKFVPSVHLAFGSAVHAVAENYLINKVIDLDLAKNLLDEYLEKNKNIIGFQHYSTQSLMLQIMAIFNDVPDFLNAQFPEYEVFAAEEQLYENLTLIESLHDDVSFKGFIDCILSIKNKKNEKIYWIIDWKTAGRPWGRDKLSDETIKMQLILYKNFWARKHKIDLKNVRCGYIILLKNGKKNRCQFIPISVGDVTSKRSLKVLNNFVGSVKGKIAIKNRNSCKYCDYFETEHCT